MLPANQAESNVLSAAKLAQRAPAESKGRTPENLFYVYILRCSDGSYYVGSTSDVDARVRAHNSGKDLHPKINWKLSVSCARKRSANSLT